MNAPAEAWLLVAAIAAIGITAMLLTMAAAIRHGSAVINLEHRVKTLRAHHRAELIARGLIEADPEDATAFADVDIIEPDDPAAASPTPRQAA